MKQRKAYGFQRNFLGKGGFASNNEFLLNKQRIFKSMLKTDKGKELENQVGHLKTSENPSPILCFLNTVIHRQ